MRMILPTENCRRFFHAFVLFCSMLDTTHAHVHVEHVVEPMRVIARVD